MLNKKLQKQKNEVIKVKEVIIEVEEISRHKIIFNFFIQKPIWNLFSCSLCLDYFLFHILWLHLHFLLSFITFFSNNFISFFFCYICWLKKYLEAKLSLKDLIFFIKNCNSSQIKEKEVWSNKKRLSIKHTN